MSIARKSPHAISAFDGVSWLIDTNVLSEVRRPQPDGHVLAWLEGVDEDRTFVSVLTLAEIRRGALLLDAGRRREQLTAWVSEELAQRFEGRILPVDLRVADAWASLTASASRRGVGIGTMDSLIAATAIMHGLDIVTRNTRHFEPHGIACLNPWDAA